MESLRQDVRLAVRLLRKQPGFSLLAIATLALGIAASTAIFSVIDAAMLRPLPYPNPEQLVTVRIEVTRPDATLKEGRLPTDADYASGLRGVVLNEPAARALFPDGPAVGRAITRPSGSDRDPWMVLGVIGDIRHGRPLAGPRSQGFPHVYFPLEPTEFDLNQAMLAVVRPSGRTADLGDRLRQAAQAIGPRVLVERIRTANDYFGDRVITPRRRTVLLSLLGGLGMLLALVGVFGMTAYAVARRTQEIGVRMAFGATPGNVVGVMVRDAAWPVLFGVGVGLVGCGGPRRSSRASSSRPSRAT